MRHTSTSVELRGAIVGHLWWPIGAWGWRDAPGASRHDRRPDHIVPRGDICCADHMGDVWTASGDFQGAMIARGSDVMVTRETVRTDDAGRIVARTVRSRIIPADRFRSLAPYLAPEDAPTLDDMAEGWAEG